MMERFDNIVVDNDQADLYTELVAFSLAVQSESHHSAQCSVMLHCSTSAELRICPRKLMPYLASRLQRTPDDHTAIHHVLAVGAYVVAPLMVSVMTKP